MCAVRGEDGSVIGTNVVELGEMRCKPYTLMLARRKEKNAVKLVI